MSAVTSGLVTPVKVSHTYTYLSFFIIFFCIFFSEIIFTLSMLYITKNTFCYHLIAMYHIEKAYSGRKCLTNLVIHTQTESYRYVQIIFCACDYLLLSAWIIDYSLSMHLPNFSYLITNFKKELTM